MSRHVATKVGLLGCVQANGLHDSRGRFGWRRQPARAARRARRRAQAEERRLAAGALDVRDSELKKVVMRANVELGLSWGSERCAQLVLHQTLVAKSACQLTGSVAAGRSRRST